MRVILLSVILLLGLAACSSEPPQAEYCGRMGIIPSNPEYGNCTAYFHKMNNWFESDFAQCRIEADRLYPDALYDNGDISYGRVWGPRGGWDTVEIRTNPDYRKNRLLESLRMNVINPCMQKKGWVSGESWEFGRAKGTPDMPRGRLKQNLPWLK